MKRIIILMLFIFLNLPCFAEDVIYLDKKSDKNASKILYEYALKEVNMTPQKAYEAFGYRLSDVKAVFYDLNSDGVDEIVGYIDSVVYSCVEGTRLFILKKENNQLLGLSNLNFCPESGVYILDTKSNDFSDVKIFGFKIQLHDNPKLHITTTFGSNIAKYHKQHYVYFFPD